MKRFFFFIFVFICFFGYSHAYTPSARDLDVIERAKNMINDRAVSGGKEQLIYMFGKTNQAFKELKDNTQSSYILQEILTKIQERLHADHNVRVDRDKEIIPITAPSPAVIAEDPAPAAPAAASPVGSSMADFWYTYGGKLTSDTPILANCTKYYPQIDAIAKEHDFPTALIIATRYREHTCHFYNPGNGWGNFQIISHSYPAGDISWSDFEYQVINFINFSKAKRDYYDNIQVFGEEPVSLGHDSIDLLSLRKHAILYNGIAAGTTPTTNVYANQNFDRPADGRDGIVAMTLKTIERALEQQGVDTAPKVAEQVIDSPVSSISAQDVEKADEVNQDTDTTENTNCSGPFTTNLSPGDEGQTVAGMQTFLKEQGLFTADTTGYYGEKTTEAVNAFQALHKEEILDPGGYDKPTGRWYPATRRKANEVYCG